MNCPACTNHLTEIALQGIKVDVCQGGCGGIWFDKLELKKFDEKHEPADILLRIDRKKDLTVDKKAKRPCPRCVDIKMMKHFYSVKKQIEIDECGQCGGVWLDGGEIKSIRDLFEHEEEKNAAADTEFSKLINTHFAAEARESKESLERAQKFAHALRFICPSYYIPGKQEWGAF